MIALLLAIALQVRGEPYRGWETGVHLEAPKAKAEAVFVPDAGGRCVSYGLAGENLLFDNPDYIGKTLANAPADSLAQGYIGYNIDLGPELRGIPRHLKLWMGGFEWSKTTGGIRLKSEHDPAVGMSITKEVTIDDTTGELHFSQVMKNSSEQEQSYCLWDRTLCKGGGFAIIPLNPKSAKPAGWGAMRDKKYETPEHPNVKVLDGVLVAKAEGKSSKLGADSDAGWIAYARGKQMIVKYFPYYKDGKYTDGGCSVECYFDPKVCELEPLSPEVALKPGETYNFPERWLLIALDREVSSHEEARELAKKVPANPFRK